jgi:Fe-S cluster biogenesis protein NfuA
MKNSLQYKEIKNFIDQKIAPGILSHGGTVRVLSLDKNILTLELSGSCTSCSVQAYTSESISNYILEEFPELEDVLISDSLL